MHAKGVVVSNDRSVSDSFEKQHVIRRSLILALTTPQWPLTHSLSMAFYMYTITPLFLSSDNVVFRIRVV
jgi:hypothetical protein